MTTIAWYPLPQSGSALSAGDEFFDNQSASWSLWSFNSSDDQNAAGVHLDKHVYGGTQCGTGRSEERSKGPAAPEPQPTQPTDDIFLSQFSDEEMRRMEDAPFAALDMFPDSMHRLLSYENMLSGVLIGSEADKGAKLDQNGVDNMDTCGFPLFSHDLQDDLTNADGPDSAETLADPPSIADKAGMGPMKRSRSISDTESAPGFEALVLEELEDVVFQLTKKTRICFRDAFFRLAESSIAKCSTANGAAEVCSSRQSVQQPEGNASRVPARGCPERESNAIDRTVADLTLKPPCPAPLQLHGSCCASDSGAEAQSTTSWATRA